MCAATTSSISIAVSRCVLDVAPFPPWPLARRADDVAVQELGAAHLRAEKQIGRRGLKLGPQPPLGRAAEEPELALVNDPLGT